MLSSARTMPLWKHVALTVAELIGTLAAAITVPLLFALGLFWNNVYIEAPNLGILQIVLAVLAVAYTAWSAYRRVKRFGVRRAQRPPGGSVPR